MTAEIVQIRDFQSKKAIERAHKELLAEHQKIINASFPSVFGFSDGIDGMAYTAPEKDPA